jgi:hypothetical protein
MAIKENTEFQITITAKEINIILDGLANQPYKVVHPLIEKIHLQIRNQQQTNSIKSLDKG